MSLNFTSKTFNSLKRRYPIRIDYYNIVQNDVDLTTGIGTRTYNSVTIPKALVLPTKVYRDFDYDIAYLAANKNFTEGGVFDRGLVTLGIAREDFKTIKPKGDDFVIYLSRKWLVKDVHEWGELRVYEIQIQECQGNKEFFFKNTDVLVLDSGGTNAT